MMKGKRRLAALLTAAMTVITAAAPLLSAAGINAAGAVTGDINSDTALSSGDITLLQKYLLGSVSLTAAQKTAADINGDGKLNVFDLNALKKQFTVSSFDEDFSGLLINEVCTSNKKVYTDATGAEPDWIELFNSSDHDMALDGVGVSDGAKNKYKFTFPDGTVIPAGGYIIVCCDDAVNQAEGEYHAAFKLSAAGETVYLTHTPTSSKWMRRPMTTGSFISTSQVPQVRSL